jgi:hypothetical protein
VYHEQCAEYWGRPHGYFGETDAKLARMIKDKGCQRYREVIIANFNEYPRYGFCNLGNCVIHYPGKGFSIWD